MVIFGVKVESENQEIKEFVYKTNLRFSKVLFFRGFLNYDNDTLMVNMKPLIFKAYWFGLFAGLIIFYFAGFNIFTILSLVVFGFGFFWTRYFFYLFLRIGLRKADYKGFMKLQSDQQTLEGVVYGTK